MILRALNGRKQLLLCLSIALVVFTELSSERGARLLTTALAAPATQTITVTLFGPQEFTRSTGKPDAIAQSFSVPPSVHAPFRLVADSGDTNGSNRVSSAHILINAVEVAGPADFNEQIAHLDREITLNASNVLTVQLEGQPGSLLTISVTGRSETVGALGGLITVTDPMSPIDGATVQIPPGALTQETSVIISKFSPGDLQNATGRNLSSSMRFAGGLTIDAGGVVLQKPATVSLPNTLLLSPSDQLLVGRLDPTRPAPANLIYQGTAQLGSIDFSVSGGGSFAVLSPVTQLVLLRGRLVDSLGAPMAGALIVSGNPTLLAATTDSAGGFTIPAGPPGTYGLLGAAFASSGALLGLALPPSLPPFGVADLVSDMAIKHFDLEGLPFPPCPPGGPSPDLLMRERNPINGALALAQGETVHTFVQTGTSGVYGGHIVEPNALQNALTLDIPNLAFLGSLTIYESVRFGISDSSIARFDPPLGSDPASSDQGTLVGVAPVPPGNPNPKETAIVTTVEMSLGGFGLLFPCARTIQPAPRDVSVFGIVTSALPNGNMGQPYSASIVTGGRTASLHWSLSGARGLTINGSPTDSSVGIISGAPLDAGTNTAVVSVTDANGLSTSRSFIITVSGEELRVAVEPHSSGPVVMIVAGRGFQPGEDVKVTSPLFNTLFGIPDLALVLSADASGGFAETIDLPVDFPPGPYSLRAVGASSGLTAQTSFTIIATGCGFPGEPSCGTALPLD